MANGIIEKIRTAEAHLQADEGELSKKTLALAGHYEELVEEAGSQRKAAKVAKDEGLRYAHHGHLGKLLRWAELVESIQGGHSVSTPPFTEGQIRPLLTQHFWDEAGPGGLMDLWNELDDQTPKAFIAKARETYPKKKKREPADVKFEKALKPAIEAASKSRNGKLQSIFVPRLFEAAGEPTDLFALQLGEAIAAKWGSLDKFTEIAMREMKKSAKDRAKIAEAVMKEMK